MSIDLQALRRELHLFPEVGLNLPRTQQHLLAALDGLPLELTLGRALSSITGVLRGRGSGTGERRVVLLRADMDGLPVVEQTDEPFACTTGTMHACGHDLHMAMLVGAAHALSARVDELAGDVVFMFQPGEEGDGGARYMIEEGVLDAAGRRPDAAYALHVWSSLSPHGYFCTKPGAMMASSDSVDVTVLGQGGHGSAPHRAKDPVPPMAEMITALQVMLTRKTDPLEPAVISTGVVQAGQACNVIPATAFFSSTVRTFSAGTRELVLDQFEHVARGIADAHGVGVDVVVNRLYPVTHNDPARTDVAAGLIDELFPGRQERWTRPLTASEDFSMILEQVPGSFIGLSALPPGADPATAPFNHSPFARFDDAVLDDGARLFTELAVRELGR